MGPLWMCQQGTASHMTRCQPGLLQRPFKPRLSHSAPWSASCLLWLWMGIEFQTGVFWVYLQIVNFCTRKIMVSKPVDKIHTCMMNCKSMQTHMFSKWMRLCPKWLGISLFEWDAPQIPRPSPYLSLSRVRLHIHSEGWSSIRSHRDYITLLRNHIWWMTLDHRELSNVIPKKVNKGRQGKHVFPG